MAKNIMIEHMKIISCIGKDDSMVCVCDQNNKKIIGSIRMYEDGFWIDTIGYIELLDNNRYSSDENVYSFVAFQNYNETKEEFIHTYSNNFSLVNDELI